MSFSGGKLAGNDEHVFVVTSGSVIDLNDDQADVLALGSLAHLNLPSTLAHQDYRDALGSCVPRASKWAGVALTELLGEEHEPGVKKSLLDVSITP